MKNVFSSRGVGVGPMAAADDNSAQWDRGKRAKVVRRRCSNAESSSNISRILPATLIAPEVAEPVGRKLSVADGVLDVLVAEIMLQGTGIVPIVGKLIAARMPQHVRMQ